MLKQYDNLNKTAEWPVDINRKLKMLMEESICYRLHYSRETHSLLER
jgi:hypothetical protein